jgi:hypothetical protein
MPPRSRPHAFSLHPDTLPRITTLASHIGCSPSRVVDLLVTGAHVHGPARVDWSRWPTPEGLEQNGPLCKVCGITVAIVGQATTDAQGEPTCPACQADGGTPN